MINLKNLKNKNWATHGYITVTDKYIDEYIKNT